MSEENDEKLWSSRWYKISLRSAEIKMHLGPVFLKTLPYLKKTTSVGVSS